MTGEWRCHHQGVERTLVYLPGWATDARLLPRAALTWNIIAPDGLLYAPAQLDGLAAFLRAGAFPPVLVVGWSLGGFLAAEFARRHPDLVSGLLLASIRPHYPPEAIAPLREALCADTARGLRRFYRQCFFPAQQAQYPRFRAEVEGLYVREFPPDLLLAGLDYLASARLSPATWPSCPVTCLHGTEDIVAPAAEARALADAAGIPLRALPAAHAVVWTEAFVKAVNDA